MEGGEEVRCGLEVARGDAAEVFEAVEEPFDPVALAVEVPVHASHHPDVRLARDMCRRTARLDGGDDRLSEVAPVADDVAGQSERRDKRRRGGLVRGLAGRQEQPNRQAATVHDRMDLGRQASTGETDGVILAPFFPPAACWWARTMELSIRCSDPGERAARASKMRSQTPLFAHLLYRL